MRYSRKDLRDTLVGVAFLTPNICGFLAFTFVPLVISLFMAFTNWNLELHNVFRDTPLQFVGFANFQQLLAEKDFYKYLGNTLFLMMGIPFGVGGSLVSALLLSSDFRGGNRRIWVQVIAMIGLIVGCMAMVLTGMGSTAMTILICGLAGVVLLSGSLGGQTVYRTLFYFPHFTAGVATFILWKKLYSPETGPINYALRPLLDRLAPLFQSVSPSSAYAMGGVLSAMMLILLLLSLLRASRLWREGELGSLSGTLAVVIFSLPVALTARWTPFHEVRWVYWLLLCMMWVGYAGHMVRGRRYKAVSDRGMADAILISGAVMVLCLILTGLTRLVCVLPTMAMDGLEPPKWISDYSWAKPSIMIMGFWAAIGSNNMLLYLAGLSGVPTELYEAADIDGANSLQRFWHVTWPQLANVTFFILVMAVINGLQGGFEMARTMTQGGPFHATTTLSYYIYTEGFATGRLGYASAVSWALFALVLSVTLVNWKFGNRYTNE
jgi:multiple sugar transport system permease protein